MRLAFLAAAALAALAAGAAFGQAEPPLRDCSTRAEPTRGKLRLVAAGDVVIGPLSFSSLERARARSEIDRKDGRWFRKAAVKVLYGNDVTLSVPEAYRDRLSLEYGPLGEEGAAVTFRPCPPGTPMHNGERHGRVTGFSGAFLFTRLGCYPLEVRVERGRTYRRTISLGGGGCES